MTFITAILLKAIISFQFCTNQNICVYVSCGWGRRRCLFFISVCCLVVGKHFSILVSFRHIIYWLLAPYAEFNLWIITYSRTLRKKKERDVYGALSFGCGIYFSFFSLLRRKRSARISRLYLTVAYLQAKKGTNIISCSWLPFYSITAFSQTLCAHRRTHAIVKETLFSC